MSYVYIYIGYSVYILTTASKIIVINYMLCPSTTVKFVGLHLDYPVFGG